MGADENVDLLECVEPRQREDDRPCGISADFAPGLRDVFAVLADETRCPIPELVRRELLRQLEGIRASTTRIAELERQMGSWQRRESECQRIAAIPGVGRLTASAVVATVADARTFRSGREFAAFLGLVPRQSGTGGRVKLLGSASAAIRTCGRC